MTIKIHGGTARADEPSLCLRCSYATIVRGATPSQCIVRCGDLQTLITFDVTSCNRFRDSRHPSLYHMEDIAWVLRTDARRNKIGFVRGKNLPFEERLTIDDE